MNWLWIFSATVRRVKATTTIYRVNGYFWEPCRWDILIRPIWNGWLAGKWIGWN